MLLGEAINSRRQKWTTPPSTGFAAKQYSLEKTRSESQSPKLVEVADYVSIPSLGTIIVLFMMRVRPPRNLGF